MKRLAILLTVLTLVACHGSYDSSEPMYYEDNRISEITVNSAMEETKSRDVAAITSDEIDSEKEKFANTPVNGKKASKRIEEKIKKNAYLNITVKDYNKARTSLAQLLKSKNAYLGSEYEENTTYYISNQMVIRVPSKNFESIINGISGIAEYVNSKSITAEDVTDQYIDITSRLKSKKEIEKRYLSILKKAIKVEEILEVEQKLGEIREEIEAKEGQLKYLNDQVDYSTINLTLQQNFEYNPTERPGFFGRVGNAFGNGWNGFLGFLVGLVYLWPMVLGLSVSSFFLVRFIKRRRAKRKSSQPKS